MTNDFEVITTTADFPLVSVSKKRGKPRYLVVFYNIDGSFADSSAAGAVCMTIFVVVFIGVGVALKKISDNYDFAVNWLLVWLGISFVLSITLLVAAMHWYREYLMWIDIDAEKDEIRVIRKRGNRGVVQQTQKLSRLQSLTVEMNPMGQLERAENKGETGIYQKQHQLVGYFGIGGAARVELVNRYEFPMRHSLREVREAVECVRGLIRRETAQGGDLAPPLD